ncbi:DsbC family protein [Desulfurivibrio sp. D14AmB]|uniref:DsbC family protein n=1 Tax=Desulfurivibrio sp. D14AmB TaxID=3374370 RepID=UPI00376ED8A0
MRKKLALLALLLTVSATPAPGSTPTESAAASLRQTFANFEFQEVRETPVAGLFEVISEQNILYYAPASGHLIFGEIWDQSGTNLTDESREEQAARLIAALPLDKAIKVGDGPVKVVEFSNPDCGHCRRASSFFADRKDVARYVFLVDFGNEKTTAKNRYILAAADQAAAYQEVMSGANSPAVSSPAGKADQLLAEHRQLAARMGVRGTPQFWIEGTHVRGADLPAIEALLAEIEPRR